VTSEISGGQGGYGRVWEIEHGRRETGSCPFFDEGILFAALAPYVSIIIYIYIYIYYV
jgi:hypothetical protein